MHWGGSVIQRTQGGTPTWQKRLRHSFVLGSTALGVGRSQLVFASMCRPPCVVSSFDSTSTTAAATREGRATQHTSHSSNNLSDCDTTSKSCNPCPCRTLSSHES
eukprot:4831877-Amphidinium_carterae.1